ncbi:MAG: hypothetical protein RL088_3382 [Verrucomicrobiota bacterium]|jgi:protein SCO1/2
MTTSVFFLLTAFALAPLHAAEKKSTPPCCRVGLKPGKYSEKSIYQIPATWKSDLGNDAKLDVSRGRPVVMAMFFSNCQHSCPTIVADMKAIEKKLPRSARNQTDFVLISIDPARDTIEALGAFRSKYKLGKEHWLILRGGADDVKKVADFTGFRYSAGSETQYAHSLLITVLNKSGEVIYQQSGLGVAPDEAAKTIVAEAARK